MSLRTHIGTTAIALTLLTNSGAMAAKLPVFGHYSVRGVVASLTANGGADCSAYIAAGGTTAGEFSLNTVANTPAQKLRVFGQPTPTTEAIYEFRLIKTSGTKASQAGNIEIIVNGTVQVPASAATYTATETAIDANSFLVSVTATVPGDTGAGTCVQASNYAMIRSSAD